MWMHNREKEWVRELHPEREREREREILKCEQNKNIIKTMTFQKTLLRIKPFT